LCGQNTSPGKHAVASLWDGKTTPKIGNSKLTPMQQSKSGKGVQFDMFQNSPLANIKLYDDAVPQALFSRLYETINALDDGRSKGKSGYSTTFWFPRGATPTNIAEETITTLCEKLDLPDGCIGAEWWLGRLRYGKKLNYHFDRDLALSRKTGESVFPLMGSILYLNAFPSAPTVILDQVPGPDGKSKVPAESKLSVSVEAIANQYVTYPGNLRHGVIPNWDKMQADDPSEEEKSKLRLTFLVNYWHRRPSAPICRDYDGSVYPSLAEEFAA